ASANAGIAAAAARAASAAASTAKVPGAPALIAANAGKPLDSGPHALQSPRGNVGPLVTGGGMTLYVLDMENGLILPNTVSVNDFSTYNVELDADMTGAAASSYSWDTSQASDAQNVSGASTYRLTFNWASFTATTPRTDTVSV